MIKTLTLLPLILATVSMQPVCAVQSHSSGGLRQWSDYELGIGARLAQAKINPHDVMDSDQRQAQIAKLVHTMEQAKQATEASFFLAEASSRKSRVLLSLLTHLRDLSAQSAISTLSLEEREKLNLEYQFIREKMNIISQSKSKYIYLHELLTSTPQLRQITPPEKRKKILQQNDSKNE